MSTNIMQKFMLEEATIEEIQSALSQGVISSVELTTLYLNRIRYYDSNNLALNAVPILNEFALEEAAQMDRLRQKGIILSALHGIPFTVKDSYMVKNLTVAAGSPAFATVIANQDSFIVEQLRKAGAILIGKTNMPPMAAGGMQSGLYGRAESPYNKNYLAAAWFSGSSNGSAVATAANFATFGMAEETVSSGRSPASNNGLVAYTPSRGLLSIRGNWPLFPTRDVVVPHTRTMDDLFHLLNIIMIEDPCTKNDFWREQTAVELPSVREVRPDDFTILRNANALKGARFAVPKRYIGKDELYIRPSILKLWEQAVMQLEQQGATVIEVDLPLQQYYEQDPIFLKNFEEAGYLPEGWMEKEWTELNAYSAENFLSSLENPYIRSWAQLNATTIFPNPRMSVYERYGKNHARYDELISTIKKGIKQYDEISDFKQALQGLERARKELFEQWLQKHGFDAIIFPANCNIGQANAETDENANKEAWENGNFFSNGNYYLRHLGIPTVSICMGIMEDTQMPVNLTFAGAAYNDNTLLSYGYAYEQVSKLRKAPLLTPPLVDEVIERPISYIRKEGRNTVSLQAKITGPFIQINCQTDEFATICIYINGEKQAQLESVKQVGLQVTLAKFLPPHYIGNGELVVTVLVLFATSPTIATEQKIQVKNY